MTPSRRWGLVAGLVAVGACWLTATPATSATTRTAPGAVATATTPNVFFYNLDDLRDALPGGLDPLQFMPKVRRWMATGTRYREVPHHLAEDPAAAVLRPLHRDLGWLPGRRVQT